ncbi:hypothetical protein [Faecalibacterium sp. PGM34]
MMFTLKKIALFPISLFAAFLALMAKWLLNLSAFVLALPMLYIFGCGLYTLYCREWLQFLILLVAEFGCFLLITAATVIAEAVEWFSGWIAER